MKTGAIFLILFSCFTLNAMAANTTTVFGYPNGQPTTVCASTSANNQCLGQGGGGGGSGNVGIGTATRIPVYQGTTTIGSPYNNVMDSNGNVGIAASSPIQPLDVEGAAFILGNLGIGTSGQSPNQIVNVYQSKNSGTTVSVENDSAGGNATSQFQTFNGTKTFKFGITGTGFSTSGPQVQGQGYIGSGSGLNIYSGGSSAIGIWPGGVETAIIDGNGNFGIGTITPIGGLAVMNGNVGIGTWVPGQLLDVSGIIRGSQVIDTGVTASRPALIDGSNQIGTGTYSGNTTTFATTTGSLTSGNFASWDSSGNAVASGTANTAAGIVGLFSTCSGTQYLGADGACHTASGSNFWINDSGNVGINTTYNVGIGTNSQVSTLNILGNVGIGSTNGDKYLTVVPPVGGMNVQSNVGIGTWLSQSLLDVNGRLEVNSISMATIQNNQRDILSTVASSWGLGWTNENGIANVSGLGDGVMGYVNCTGSVNACSTISQVSGHGSLMGGDMETTSGQGILFNSSANGTFGWVNSSAAASNTGFSISQTGNGSWVGGNIENSGATVGFTTSGKGCFAFGDIIGAGSNSNFNCTAQGAIAMGVSNSGTIQAGGRAAIALGENVQANANDAISIGSAVVNGQPTTIAMGFTSTPAFLMQGSNIGLGTITPLATLQVVGNIGIGTITNGDLFITTSPPSGGMIIENNVGIGTVHPGQALDVNGAGRFLGTGNTLLNPTSGNVGIGTTNPQATLDLGTSGQIRSNNTSGMGCKVKTGANTACNTTCSGGGCFIGFDTGLGSSDIVSCTDATADSCVCCNPA